MIDPYRTLQDQAQADGIESVVVGLIVRRGNKLLLLKRRSDDYMPDVWEIPGGHVDPGETIPQALSRELLEETGLHLHHIIGKRGGYDYPGEFGLTRQWNFEVKAPGLTIHHPEHTDYRWASPEMWAHLAMSPEMRQSLEDYARRWIP